MELRLTCPRRVGSDIQYFVSRNHQNLRKEKNLSSKLIYLSAWFVRAEMGHSLEFSNGELILVGWSWYIKLLDFKHYFYETKKSTWIATWSNLFLSFEHRVFNQCWSVVILIEWGCNHEDISHTMKSLLPWQREAPVVQVQKWLPKNTNNLGLLAPPPPLI